MTLKLNLLSKNIISIIETLNKNQAIKRLVSYNESTPFSTDLPDVNDRNLINPNSKKCKIFPFPFDPDAQLTEGSFIRVYYPNGRFSDSEVINDTTVVFDIVCAKSNWLINDGTSSLIRPYEILSRIVDMLGRNSVGKATRLKFEGYNHLSVNTHFDAIRVYSSFWSVEAGERNDDY